jgi:hypothetical protein
MYCINIRYTERHEKCTRTDCETTNRSAGCIPSRCIKNKRRISAEISSFHLMHLVPHKNPHKSTEFTPEIPAIPIPGKMRETRSASSANFSLVRINLSRRLRGLFLSISVINLWPRPIRAERLINFFRSSYFTLWEVIGDECREN